MNAIGFAVFNLAVIVACVGIIRTTLRDRKQIRESKARIKEIVDALSMSPDAFSRQMVLQFNARTSNHEIVEKLSSTEPLTGWRVMLLNGDGSLMPLIYTDATPPYKRWVASCRYHDHKSPDVRCNCGFHTTIDASKLASYVAADPLGKALCIVKVSMWGTVVVRDSGYRAQYCYPSEIIVGPYGHASGTLAEDKYGVPVTLAHDLLKYTRSIENGNG